MRMNTVVIRLSEQQRNSVEYPNGTKRTVLARRKTSPVLVRRNRFGQDGEISFIFIISTLYTFRLCRGKKHPIHVK